MPRGTKRIDDDDDDDDDDDVNDNDETFSCTVS